MKALRSSKAALRLQACLAATLLAGPLQADDPPAPSTPPAATAPNAQVSATAEALFEEGRTLIKDKKYAQACPKLVESLRIDPAIGTMLYLADCYEKNGQTASAWATFNDAASTAHNAGQGEREVKAKLRVQALVPKLVRLKLTLDPANVGVAGLELKRNGLAVGAALFGIAVPVDPGDQKIEISAPGKKSWFGVASVPSKAGTVIDFVVPALEELPQLAPPEPTVTATAIATTPPPTATVTTTVVVPPPPRLPTVVPYDGPMRTVGVVVGAAGVAGVIAASVLGLTAKSKNDEALTSGCDGKFCTNQAALDLTNDARSLAVGSTVAFIVGGVAIATGLGLIIYPSVTSPSPPVAGKLSKAPPAPRLRSEVVVGPASLLLRGRF